MAKINLTSGRIATFDCPPEKSQAFLWATSLSGFGVRAAGSKKTFIFQSRLNGDSIRLTIGPTDAWSITEAEAEARRLQVLIDKNQDPREVRAEQTAQRAERKAEQVAASQRRTITGLSAWEAYCIDRKPQWGQRNHSDHVGMARAGGEQHKRGGGVVAPGPLYALLALPLADIDAEAVLDWVTAEMKTRPARARLGFRLLQGFLNWCAESGKYRSIAQPDATKERRTRERLGKPESKDDVLQREQLALWFAHVRQIGNPAIAAYLQCLLITGARREELLNLRWTDIDFQWRSLIIRDKVEGTRTIPLTPMMAQLLGGLPRRNRWVFSSPSSANGRLQEPRIAHNRALDAAGLPKLTLHGLRRSFGTLSEWVECPVGIVAQIMGHKPSAIAEKHYRRRPLDLLRVWHEKIETWLLEQAGIEVAQNDAGLRLVK